MLQTYTQIIEHKFVGNHAADSQAFRDIDTFVRNEDNPLAHRAAALYAMCAEGMGLTHEECGLPPLYAPGRSASQDAEFVEAYIADA